MRKIALLLSAVAVMAAFGVLPAATAATAAQKNHKPDGDETLRNALPADDTGNDVGNGDETGFSAAALAAAEPAKTPQKQPSSSSSKLHNAKLLNRLGMKRVRTAAGSHHRKRLASQSRSKYGADGKGGSDSQMFIVKLPPHSHFYDDGSAAAVHQKVQHKHHPQQHQPPAPYKSLNTVPVGFVSNGKPAKVYHWNLPVIKHALQGGRYKGGKDGVVAVHHLGPYNNHYPQPAGEFEMPRRTLYYKPRSAGKPVKKSFVNNGKPNGFYVVSSKNAAAVPQYHKIVKAYYGNGDD